MDRIRIDCLGLCETRWTNIREFSKGKRKFFYFGGSKYQRGVALVLNYHFAKSVLSFWPKNENMLLVKLKSSPSNLNVIVSYASTADADEEEINEFYKSLDDVYKTCKSKEITIVMGDFNANVGEEPEGKIIRQFGL